MKLSVILPHEYVGLLRARNLSHHMVLAQYVLEYPAEFWRGEHDRGSFILLDNGVAEGIQMPFEQVLCLADYIHADEIIMPDVMGDCEQTLSNFLDWRPQVPLRKRMAVPHGSNWGTWTDCLLNMCDMGCRSIGVAKRYEAFDGGRPHALQIIEDRHIHWSHDVHLLGCYARPYEEIRRVANQFPWVRSVDTAAPLAYAQHHVDVTTDAHYSVDWRWVSEIDFAILANIDLLLEASNAFNLEES